MKALRFLAGVLAAVIMLPTMASAAPDDPDLQQQVDPNDPVVTDKAILDHGHIDLGPKFVDGEWTFLIHDDLARADANAQSLWRHAENTVFAVPDTAMLPVPDDPAYGFLGMPAGSNAWVLPQTQEPDSPWIGWNSQDPEVMERIDRGMTLRMDGVEGPGHMVGYLQAGDFGEPDLLWDSRKTEPQELWVDVNTHTHANWVFSEPGVYLVRMTVSADLTDGTQVSDTRDLRFAVGDATSSDDAFAASWSSGDPPAGAEEGNADEDEMAASDSSERDPVIVVLIAAICVVAVALVLGLLISILRIRQSKRRALAEHGADR